ncbi:MAG: DUF2877 domain-containing protein [Chloroflexota bacterium]
MQLINALSLTPAVNNWLANSRHPRILHVFDHACNLINERREVLSIVTQQIGNGPFNLVLLKLPGNINLQSPISISPTQLTLGDITITTASAKLWHPRPDWEMLHAKKDDILNQIMSLRGQWFSARSNPLDNWEIASSQRTSALLATTLLFTNHQKHGLQSPVSNLQFFNPQFSNSLISSLAIADLPSSLTTAKQLAGLGQGLTPAGDDFILGALLAAWIIHPPEIARVLAEKIAKTAAPLTTSLSAAWLRSAGKGEAGILWHKFFEALSHPISSLQSPISKILSIGHTSGADALAGFFGVCSAFKERIINECPS